MPNNSDGNNPDEDATGRGDSCGVDTATRRCDAAFRRLLAYLRDPSGADGKSGSLHLAHQA